MENNDFIADELVLLAAFRYALGRATYIVAHVVHYLKINWNKFSPNHRALIKREIQEAFDDGNYGMEIDKKQWEVILNLE